MWTAILPLAGLLAGCGGGASFFNPAFINTLTGEFYPRTPGPNASYVFVRGVNETDQVLEFIVTIDREELVRDDAGNLQVDDQGNLITRTARETVRLITAPLGLAHELGVLFECGESSITRVGLGQNLLPTDAAVFVGGGGAGAAVGFGVPVGNLNPLLLEDGNFNCGDTIIFRAVPSIGVTGGVKLQSLLLPWSEQPAEFSGPNTFANLENYLETQVREDEP